MPATSTIRRILHHRADLRNRRRHRSSYHRFEPANPTNAGNPTSPTGRLADGADIEILNWLDDHSRYLLACTAYPRVTGPHVVTSFTATAAIYGLPASTLTDNGTVYTARFTNGHNDFERLLTTLGITQKNGRPGHPQTQGKIERFPPDPQTLAPPTAPPHHHVRPCNNSSTNSALIYNTQRTHRGLASTATPAAAPTATPPTAPHQRNTQRTLPNPPRHHRPVRQTHPALRQPHPPPRHRQSQRSHPSTHPGTTATTVTVISKTTYQLISSHTVDPDRNYWRNQQKNPGRSSGAIYCNR